MNARHLDVAVALESGRSIIVPSPQRAAALSLAWARLQLNGGKAVWSSPDILTWDAWLRREWQRASTGGLVPDVVCLNPSQELMVWQEALGELESETGHPGLRQFAPSLMRTAARTTQDGLRTGGAGSTEEEALLARATQRVRARCAREPFVVLPLLPLNSVSPAVLSAAPLIVGQHRLTAFQAALAELKWPGTQILATHSEFPDAEATGTETGFVLAASFEAEVIAAAEWCSRLLTEDGTRRLLVVSALAKPGLPALGNLLWRALSAGTTQEAAGQRNPELLAIEGGESLLEHGLIADALDALKLMREPVETVHLGRVLLSPYLGLRNASARAQLELAIREKGRARWSRHNLRLTLSALEDKHPVANGFSAWLTGLSRLENTRASPASNWARSFSDSLAQCGFATGSELDSRDAQRLERWNELLDEFAALDCVTAPMRALAALDQLQALAMRGRHRAASGDAAITLTEDLGDPVARYDGIWVLGLSENRWPQPPRPNPFVPLSEQRRCGWAEAGVTQRLEQARWAQLAWQTRTNRLVLSYPEMEQDVHHRPSSLLAPGEGKWIAATKTMPTVKWGQARLVNDEGALPPLAPGANPRLHSGVKLLGLQQSCAFRAQAQLRLGAAPLPTVSDGIDKRLRGTLLHRTFEYLWREFEDQQRMVALGEAERQVVFDRCWRQAVSSVPADWMPADTAVMEREMLRSRRLVARVMDLESTRVPFRVQAIEMPVQMDIDGWSLNFRIDRVDELEDGRQLLIDYKSGLPEKMLLDDVNARPIQLAAYAAALATQGAAADAVALLSLSPKELGFTGRAGDDSHLPKKIGKLDDWDSMKRNWRVHIGQLVHDHVQGVATVAPLKGACDYCHLDPLCRITDHPVETDEVDSDE